MRAISILGLLLVAPCLGAGGAGAGERPKPALFVETVRVNLVDVDVWVADRNGAPLAGLTATDFELLEDGKPVTITNFLAPVWPAVGAAGEPSGTVAAAGAGGATATSTSDGPVFVVILVDNDSVTPASRNAALRRIRTVLDPLVSAGQARVMLATSNPSVKVRLGVGEPPERIFATLDRFEREVAFDAAVADALAQADRFIDGPQRSSITRRSPNDASTLFGQAEVAGRQSFDRARMTLSTLCSLVDSLAALPGRKALFYIGNGVQVNPDAELLQRRDARWSATGAAARLASMMDAERASMAGVLDEVMGRANASRVTFFGIDAAAANRNTGTTAERPRMENDFGLGVSSTLSRRFFLQSMSARTGGAILANSADLSDTFRRAVGELTSSYALGFIAEHDGDGKLHDIDVRVKRVGARARHRESYVDKTFDDRMVDRSLAALNVGEVPNPLKVTLSFGTEIKQRDGTFIVPVVVHVPIGGLVLLPRGGVHLGTISAWLAAADEDGQVSQAAKQTFTVRVPNDRLLTALSQSVSYPVQFLMRAGHKRIAASLRDDQGLTESTATAEFLVPRVGSGPSASR